jgi:hypothetical protein
MIEIFYGCCSLFLLICARFVYVKSRELSMLLIRQTTYDAMTFVWESLWEHGKKEGSALSSEEQLELAIKYTQKIFPGMTRKKATIHCKSMLGKVPGLGYSADSKV